MSEKYTITCAICGSLLAEAFADRLWLTVGRGAKGIHANEVKLNSCASCSDKVKARAVEIEVLGRVLDMMRNCTDENVLESVMADITAMLKKEGDFTHYSYKRKICTS